MANPLRRDKMTNKESLPGQAKFNFIDEIKDDSSEEIDVKWTEFITGYELLRKSICFSK